jgi:hypothetical protein
MKNAIAVVAIFSLGLLTGCIFTRRALEAKVTIPDPIGAVNPSEPMLPPVPVSAPSPTVTFFD